jgi:hypothetical protein
VKIETEEEANNQQVLDVMVEVLGPQAGASVHLISDKPLPHKCTSREHSVCLIDKRLFGHVVNLIDGLVQDEGLDFLGEVKSAFMTLWAVYFDDSVPTAIKNLNRRRILLTLCIFRAYLCAFSKIILKLGLALGSTMGAESVMKKVKQDTEKLSVTSKKLKQIVAGMNNLVKIGRQRSAAKMGVQQHSTMPMLLEGSIVETPDATAARHGNRSSGCLDEVSAVEPFLATQQDPDKDGDDHHHGGELGSLSDPLLVYVENTYTVDAWEYLVRSDKMPDQDGGLIFNRNNNRRNVRQKIDLDG